MRKFMLYPFLYILNYLRLRRNAKLKSVTPMKIVAKVKSTLDNLKKTLRLKKKTTVLRSSFKMGSIIPEDSNSFNMYEKWIYIHLLYFIYLIYHSIIVELAQVVKSFLLNGIVTLG